MWSLMTFFTTVSSIGKEDEQPPDHWEQFCLDDSCFTLVDSPPKLLQDDWLNVEQKELKYHALQRETGIRSTIQGPVTYKNTESLQSSENTSIKSTDKNTIPAQAIQVVKTEKEISGPVEENEENVAGSAMKHEEIYLFQRE